MIDEYAVGQSKVEERNVPMSISDNEKEHKYDKKRNIRQHLEQLQRIFIVFVILQSFLLISVIALGIFIQFKITTIQAELQRQFPFIAAPGFYKLDPISGREQKDSLRATFRRWLHNSRVFDVQWEAANQEFDNALMRIKEDKKKRDAGKFVPEFSFMNDYNK